MPIHAIAPSPVARLLLELAERGASGGIEVGGRRLVLTKGSIVEVRPAADDASLGDFLVASGRLTAEDLASAKKQSTETRTALEAVLRQRDLVPVDVLLDTRRALWLDRFVRGLASEEAAGKQPAMLTPEPHPAPGPAISALAFVLDALTRRAGFGDAEQVGRSAKAWFDWIPSAVGARAQEWAELGEVEDAIPVSALFARHPAAPSRIAALVRAGLARLSETRPSLPPPEPRPSVIAAPAPAPIRVETSGSIAPPAEVLVTMLEPGSTKAKDRPLGIEPVASWFPTPGRHLEDPLDPLERQIASFEQAGAPPADRAQAWLALARAVRVELDSVEEAARACREAAASDPTDEVALEAAAELCAAIGKPDVALAYALAASDRREHGPQRAMALSRASDFALRAGKPAQALKALKSATEASPDDPVLLERLARALAARGDVSSAVRAARACAERYRAARPEASAAVLSWAVSLSPDDPEVLTEHASALANCGLGEAACAALLRAARKASDADLKRRLYLNAAVRAELAARPDLAADALLEAHDLGVAARGNHEQLINNLTTLGATVEIAVIAAELASAKTGSERSYLLTLAAEARLELPGDPTEAVELFTQALIADPKNARAFSAIRQFASDHDQPRLLTDALERALKSDTLDRAGKLELLPAFIADVGQGSPAPLLERWAWALSARLGGPGPDVDAQKAYEARLSQYEAELRQLEGQLRSATAETRTELGLALADRMRDDPTRRAKARKLYEKILELSPMHPHARVRLFALLRLEGDVRAICVVLTNLVNNAHTNLEKVGAELARIRAEREAGNDGNAIEGCLHLLSHAPKNREAVVWLSRLSAKAADPALLREARARRVEAALDPRERARALTQLARACLEASDIGEALTRCEAALTADPRAAEAAFVLLEHSDKLERGRAASMLRIARGVLGNSPDLLAALSRASFGSRDALTQLEALEAHAQVAPYDPAPFLGLVALRTTGKDARAIRDAVHAAIAPERATTTTQDTVLLALERLFQLGEKREAAELVVHAIDELGERADLLLEWAEPLVDEIEDPHVGASILERSVARASGDDRVHKLKRLARFHREREAAHAEARAYLRLLAIVPTDAEALERLAMIYASAGETGRLMSVLTLRLDLATSVEERRARIIELALAALVIGRNLDGAKDLLRAALATEQGDNGPEDPPAELLRRGIGILLGSEDPQAAFDLLIELAESATKERASEMLEEAIFIAEQFLHNPDLALRAATLGLEGNNLHTPFLLHFERLALELGDVATGREVYRHLAESSMGMHGRRAVLYRGARWLERAGALPDALELVERAFFLAPSEGAVLASLERVARGVGQHVAVLRALVALAEQSTRTDRKATLYLRAAALCEDELHERERALDLYEQSFRTKPDEEVEQRALACVKRLRSVDPEAADKALSRFRAMLEETAREAWATTTKVRALLSLAALCLDELETPSEAESYALRAQSELAADDYLPDADKRALTERINAVLARMPENEEQRTPTALVPEKPPARKNPAPDVAAARALRDADRAADDHVRATVAAVVAEQRNTRPFAEAAYGERPLHAEQSALPPSKYAPGFSARPRARTTETGLSPVVPTPSASATTVADLRTTQRGYQLDPALRRALNSARPADPPAPLPSDSPGPAFSAPPVDENSALERLIAGAAGDRERSEELCATLLQRVRTQPPTVTLLRGLRQLGRDCGRYALSQVATEALAHVDPMTQAMRAGRPLDPNDDVTKLALLEARDDADLSPLFTILAHVCQGAGPLFRRPLASFGVSANDFVPAREDGDELSVALSAVSRLLGVAHETYRSPTPEDRIQLVAASPFAVVVGARCTPDVDALRFRLARIYEQARPSSALLAALPANTRETLLAAVRAAFGPTDARSQPVPREAAAMAAELWRTMPSGTQRQVANLFRVAPRGLDQDALLSALATRSARVGLISCGALDVALLELHRDLGGDPVPRSEGGFDAACRENPVLASLLHFALSDAYLMLREAAGG